MYMLKVIGHLSLPGQREIAYKRELECTHRECVDLIKKHVLKKDLKIILIAIDGHILPDIVFNDKVHMGVDGFI